ncbi:hypothetical protein ZEAMMB73_Zm00001d004994 [Zea mays]|uniref:Uncharacterized protein n=1 Tax=Zea mays TaxID=4577 RepID=A0A1D6EIJ9_MAIZE|nr:hypothetical protein ZEAMMB73_Zm00001d004994 [Zea mays]
MPGWQEPPDDDALDLEVRAAPFDRPCDRASLPFVDRVPLQAAALLRHPPVRPLLGCSAAALLAPCSDRRLLLRSTTPQPSCVHGGTPARLHDSPGVHDCPRAHLLLELGRSAAPARIVGFLQRPSAPAAAVQPADLVGNSASTASCSR